MASHIYMATHAIVLDTFREAFARKIFWGLFGLSTAMVLFFLFIMKIDIVEGAAATISMFGLQSGKEVDAARLVKQVQAGVATFLYTWGMFLAVFASAGLIPSVLEPGRIELLLSKPISRTHLLLGRFLGNLMVVSFNIVYLVAGVWLILAFKTNIWRPEFLISIVSTIFLFSILLSVVTLIGVTLESTALAVMIPAALMVISPILAQHKIMMRLLGSEWSRRMWRGLYELLPKVYDLGKMTLDFVSDRGVESFTPVYSSAAFGAGVLALAVYIFQRRNF
ncbi:MAG: ABC transporter permease subunit [Bryobacterales bacterium]|nr:ABC transporter permease subunit [Bryobacterales bacterium]